MTPTEISSVFGGIKIATDIVKTIIAINKDVEVNLKASELLTKIIDIQTAMIDLQSKYNELVQSKSEIEEKYLQLKNWKETESQYILTKLSSGSLVRVPNDTNQSTNKEYWLCANCFEDKKISYLQPFEKFGNKQKYICNKCGDQVIDIINDSDSNKSNRFSRV